MDHSQSSTMRSLRVAISQQQAPPPTPVHPFFLLRCSVSYPSIACAFLSLVHHFWGHIPDNVIGVYVRVVACICGGQQFGPGEDWGACSCAGMNYPTVPTGSVILLLFQNCHFDGVIVFTGPAIGGGRAPGGGDDQMGGCESKSKA